MPVKESSLSGEDRMMTSGMLAALLGFAQSAAAAGTGACLARAASVQGAYSLV
jgi:hypothetical protein